MYSRKILEDGVYIADHGDPFFRKLVQEDLKLQLQHANLCIEEDLHEHLLLQSVLGHAINGHKNFNMENARFPFASMTDVIKAAGLDVEKVKGTRQRVIDEFFEWLELAKKDEVDSFTYKGRPLLGVKFLTEEDYKIDPEYALKGAILAGSMDSYEWRTKTLERFPRTIDGKKLLIGGGETYLIDPEKLPAWDMLGPEFLSEVEVSDEKIEEYKDKGAITTSGNPNAEVAYVRRRKGLGSSDDAAFILIREMYKDKGEKAARSAMLSGFLVDGIDTYDKCVAAPIEGGYDEKVAVDLRSELPDLVSDEDITSLIYYCAKGNGEKIVSSSHKRLVEVPQGVDPKMALILHHLKFGETGKFGRFKIGFDRQPSSMFYGEVSRRICHYHENK